MGSGSMLELLMFVCSCVKSIDGMSICELYNKC